MKSLQDARIGETLESGVNSVRAKLSDPEFQKDVKEKAQAGWSWLSSTAGSIWSAAKEAATQIASELNDPNANGGGTPRPAVSTPRREEGESDEARRGTAKSAGNSMKSAGNSMKSAGNSMNSVRNSTKSMESKLDSEEEEEEVSIAA